MAASLISPATFAATSFDYIVAGGGTAGLTVAARLSENSKVIVGVIEAGLDRTDDPTVLTPGFTAALWGDPKYDWDFKSTPQVGDAFWTLLNAITSLLDSRGIKPTPRAKLVASACAKNLQTYGDNRVIGHPRGKQLGGSSAINFNYWTHASQADIDNWGELGNPGWSWNELLPYYIKSETYHPPPPSVSAQIDTTFIDPAVHGTKGPVQDSFPPTYDNFYTSFEPTYKNLGLGPTGDPKGGLAIGAYSTLLTLDPRNASRSYSANSYYKPNIGRPNLKVLTGALATKVVFAPSMKPLVATGIKFTVEGKSYTASAKREVILSAGSFQSPQLLELSGIGDGSLLRSKGIAVLYDNSNVGENLQDHVLLPVTFQAAPGEGTFESLRNETVFQEALTEYTTNHDGPLAAGTTNAYVSFAQILKALEKGPIPQSLIKLTNAQSSSGLSKQFELVLKKLLDPKEASAQEVEFPGAWAYPFAESAHALATPDPATYPGNYFSLLGVLEHPFSRGRVHIISPDPTVYPRIDFNYLSSPLDLFVASQIVLHLQQVAQTAPLSTHLKSGGTVFAPNYYALDQSNAADFVKKSFSSEYHPMSTCSMLPREQGGVVDPRLKVYGTRNLRVVDASVAPLQVRGNLASMVYAIAEKASDLIKEDAKA